MRWGKHGGILGDRMVSVLLNSCVTKRFLSTRNEH